jgi:nickel transport protein
MTRTLLFNPKSKIQNPKSDDGVFMKLGLLKFCILTVTCLCILSMTVDTASAHRVNVFAWVDGDTIHVESKFSGGKKVKAGKIMVMDPQGVELLAGLTNDKGEYSFKVPKQSDLRITISTGQGHQGEWTVRATELQQGSASAEQPETGTRERLRPKKNSIVYKPSLPAGTAATGGSIQAEKLEAIIESVLDRKLKPIIRMLAETQQEGPDTKDILAGIGYIIGLVGIAAYFHNRKKKD